MTDWQDFVNHSRKMIHFWNSFVLLRSQPENFEHILLCILNKHLFFPELFWQSWIRPLEESFCRISRLRFHFVFFSFHFPWKKIPRPQFVFRHIFSSFWLSQQKDLTFAQRIAKIEKDNFKEAYRSGHNGPDSKGCPPLTVLSAGNRVTAGFFRGTSPQIASLSCIKFSHFSFRVGLGAWKIEYGELSEWSKVQHSKDSHLLVNLSARNGLTVGFSLGAHPIFPALSCIEILHFSKYLARRCLKIKYGDVSKWS